MAGGDVTGGGAAGSVSFAQLDANGDGMISQDEAQANPQLSQQFQSIDQNQDGQLDQSEFAQFESGASGGGGMSPGMEQPPAGQSPQDAPAGQSPQDATGVEALASNWLRRPAANNDGAATLCRSGPVGWA